MSLAGQEDPLPALVTSPDPRDRRCLIGRRSGDGSPLEEEQ